MYLDHIKLFNSSNEIKMHNLVMSVGADLVDKSVAQQRWECSLVILGGLIKSSGDRVLSGFYPNDKKTCGGLDVCWRVREQKEN